MPKQKSKTKIKSIELDCGYVLKVGKHSASIHQKEEHVDEGDSTLMFRITRTGAKDAIKLLEAQRRSSVAENAVSDAEVALEAARDVEVAADIALRNMQRPSFSGPGDNYYVDIDGDNISVGCTTLSEEDIATVRKALKQ